MQGSHAPSLRSRLALLVVVCVTPAAALAILLITYDYMLAKTEIVRRLHMAAHMQALEIDRIFSETESMLSTLSTSPSLSAGDLHSFYYQALNVTQKRGIFNVVLEDERGRQHLNTLKPLGETLPSNQTTNRFANTTQHGKVSITNVFQGQVSQRLVAAVGVSAMLGSRSSAILSASIPIELFQSHLEEKKYPSEWFVAMIDRDGNIVARSRSAQLFAGKKAHPDILKHIAQFDEQAFETETLEGTPILAIVERAPISDWSVAIGIPLSQFSGELNQKFRWLVGAMVVLLGVGLYMALRLAATISRSISQLIHPALALVKGEVVPRQDYGIREVEDVGIALHTASCLHVEARHQANHDPLTGLSNRNMLFGFLDQQLELCRRNIYSLSVLYIDLDQFKPVNDMHGHTIGDRLLVEVSSRLKLALRKSDLAARIGGDEFAIVLIDAELDVAKAIAEKLAHHLSHPYQFGDVVLQISASIGLANYPADANDSATLLELADRSMYGLKSQSKPAVKPGETIRSGHPVSE